MIPKKQEAPTKQGWEHKWGVLLLDIFLKSKPKCKRYPLGQLEKRGIDFIRSLLRSKDQEADRRVEEAVKRIETKIKPALEDFSKTGQKMIASGKLVRTGNEMIENVGYIKTILYQELSSKK